MRNIRYIGNSAVNKAFYPQTGIIWTPGKVDTVLDDKIAAEMLMYTDVFEDAGDSFAVNSGAMSLDPTAGLLLGGAAPNAEQQRKIRGDLGLSHIALAVSQARAYGPDVSPVNAGATVTGAAYSGNGDLATVVPLTTNIAQIIYGGGALVSNGDPAQLPLKSASVPSSNHGVSGSYTTVNFVEFMTTAENLRFRCFVGNANAAYRVSVDGKYHKKNSGLMLTLTGQVVGTVCIINISFTDHGGAGIARRVKLEWDNGVNLGALSHSTGAVWKPTDDQPRACFFGDSFFAAGAGPAYSVNMMDSVAVRTAAKLGWIPTCSAVGGTGYVSNGGGVNYTFNHANRLADLALWPFDAFVIAGGANDGAGTHATIKASALTVISHARSLRPDAPIFVAGCFNSQISTTLSQALIESAVEAAVTEFADANTFFIPVTNDPDGSWITVGNKATYIEADNVHAKHTVGEEYLADKLAAKIHAALLS